MAQVQQSDRDMDPITQSFLVDRQAFWGRFTNFTTYGACVIVLVLVGMWMFLV